MKHNFKIGDKVFDYRYGWMIVITLKIEFDEDLILITEKANNKYHPLSYDYYAEDIKFLSFTEYTLDGITQERPKEEFKVGDLGYFWDKSISHKAVYGKLTEIEENHYFPFIVGNCSRYKYFSLTLPDLNY